MKDLWRDHNGFETGTPLPISTRTHRRRSWSNICLALALLFAALGAVDWIFGERETVEIGAEPRRAQ